MKKILVACGAFLVTTSAYATHWRSCEGITSGEVQQVSVRWLEGSFGPVGPVEVSVNGRVHHYSLNTDSYPGKSVVLTGYWAEQNEVRIKLVETETYETVVELKFNDLVPGERKMILNDVRSGFYLEKEVASCVMR